MWKLKNIYMGFIFMLVNLTSVVVVTNIMGLNLPVAFAMTGVNTMLFYFITKGSLAIVIGISGLYIGPILLISEQYGPAYALGGSFMSGFIYLGLALLFKKYNDIIFKYIPRWIISFSVILIGLSLINIGADLIKPNLATGLITLAIIVIVETKAKGTLRLFSMLIGIAGGTLFNVIFNGFELVEVQSLVVTMPRFNIQSFLAISLIAFAIYFEAMGAMKYAKENMGTIEAEKVTFSQILFANGIANILNGFVGAAPATIYSEQNSAVYLTDHSDTRAEVWTSFFFMMLALISPISRIFLSIPKTVFGGCLLYLFATIIISGIKQLSEDNTLKNSKKKFIILSVMLGIFYIQFSVFGVAISSIAIAMIIGIILNILMKE